MVTAITWGGRVHNSDLSHCSDHLTPASNPTQTTPSTNNPSTPQATPPCSPRLPPPHRPLLLLRLQKHDLPLPRLLSATQIRHPSAGGAVGGVGPGQKGGAESRAGFWHRALPYRRLSGGADGGGAVRGGGGRGQRQQDGGGG